MVSAKLAAAHIIKHIQDNKFSDTINREYDLAVYKKLGKELRTNTKVLRWASAFPWLPGLGISLLSEKNPFSALFRKLL
jgi:flavin-dependent dehydrogenase